MIDIPPSPPHDLAIERSLLGGLIGAPDLFYLVDSILPAGANTFYSTKHQIVYDAIQRLVKHNEPVDIVILFSEIEKISQDITRSDLIDIAKCSCNGAIADKYAIRVAETFHRRQVLSSCRSAIDNILNKVDLSKTIRTLGKQINEITVNDSQTYAASINKIAIKWWDKCLDYKSTGTGRIYTGFKDIDKMIALLPGTHFILGARTSMGKTSFAIQMATNIAMQDKRPLLFSMEQTKESVAACYVSQISSVDRFAAMTNTLTDEQKKQIMDHAHIWGSTKIKNIGLYDKPWSAQDIKHKVITEMAQESVDIIIIDFLHNMKPPAYMKREGHEWLRETTAELEEIAIELKVPVITLAQLSRKVEARNDKRPIISDIREAGEDNADIVAFLYRDDYYNPHTEKPGIAEFIIAKNRHGQTGTVELMFLNASTEFKNL